MVTNEWQAIIDKEIAQPYFQKLKSFIKEEYATKRIYPRGKNIFRAFELTDFSEVKVVIIDQDPYHNEGQAHGLCFSVPDKQAIPPSLKNIYQELKDDVGCSIPSSGNLEKWAKQGVLLLNAVLTVVAHRPLSHSNKGWEIFTENIIRVLNDDDRPKVFLLWGAYAKKKKLLLTNPRHLVLEANHPSPLSAYRGFFGCKHFSKTNAFLIANKRQPIDWQL